MNELPSLSEAADEQPPRQVFRVGRLLCVVIPLAVLFIAAALSWGFFDISTRIAGWMLPPLVPVSGQVFLNDAPLKGAEIRTQPENGNHHGGVGFSDADGRFTLQTDVNGIFETGVYVGKHLVTVNLRDTSVGFGSATRPLLTPAEYAGFGTTPLRIDVERAPLDQVMFRLVGAVGPENSGAADRPLPPGPP